MIFMPFPRFVGPISAPPPFAITNVASMKHSASNVEFGTRKARTPNDRLVVPGQKTLCFAQTRNAHALKILTVASVAGIPPVLIAGIYGMNFKNMPELNWVWGYPFALFLIVLTTLLPLIWFKWKDWI